MNKGQPDKVTLAHVVRIVSGQEVAASYKDNDRAIKAALESPNVVRVVLIGGRIMEKADLERLGPAAVEPQ